MPDTESRYFCVNLSPIASTPSTTLAPEPVVYTCNFDQGDCGFVIDEDSRTHLSFQKRVDVGGYVFTDASHLCKLKQPLRLRFIVLPITISFNHLQIRQSNFQWSKVPDTFLFQRKWLLHVQRKRWMFDRIWTGNLSNCRWENGRFYEYVLHG